MPNGSDSQGLESALSPEAPKAPSSEIPEDKLVAYVADKWHKWRDSRDDIEKKWIEILELYLSLIDETRFKGGWKWRSKVSIPVLQKVQDSIVATLSNALVPADDFFAVLGRGPEDHELAKAMQKYMAYQMDRMHFREKFRTFLEQLVMFGTSVAAIPWRRDERIVKREVENSFTEPIFPGFPLFGSRTRVERTIVSEPVVDYDGPDFEPLNIFDFVVDPLEPNFDRTTCIHRVVVSYDAVKAKDKATNPSGIYNGTNRREQGETAPRDGKSEEVQRLQLQMLGFQVGMDNLPEDSVELLQVWGDFRVEGKLFKNHVCVVMNRKWVIRFEPNPFWHGRKPYVFGTYRPKLGSPYGRGPCEPIIGIQHLVNTFANQKADEVNLLLSGAFKYVEDGTFDPDSAFLFPGATIPVGDINNLQPLIHSAPVAVGHAEIESLLRFVEDSSAASQFVVGGAPTAGRKTATESAMTRQAGAERFMEILRHVEDQVMIRIFEMFYQLNQQFMNQNEVVRVIGPSGALFPVITPDVVRKSYDFKPMGSTFAILRDMRIQQLVNFMDVVFRNPMMAQAINPIGLVRKIYREFGFTDEEQILTPPQPAVPPGMGPGPGGLEQALTGAPSPAGPLAATPLPVPGAQMPIMQGGG